LKNLLLGAKRPVFEPHLVAVTLTAAQRRYGVLAAAPEADLEIETSMLGYLFLCSVGNWHVALSSYRQGLIYTYSANI
jgi:hypothetical protein